MTMDETMMIMILPTGTMTKSINQKSHTVIIIIITTTLPTSVPDPKALLTDPDPNPHIEISYFVSGSFLKLQHDHKKVTLFSLL